MPHNRYVRVLKWLTLTLFAYVGVVIAVDVSWANVAKDAISPSLSLRPEYVTVVVAIFGTTISPYLFFWQASQEVEDLHAIKAEKPLRDHPDQAKVQLRRIQIDTYIGMGFSNLLHFSSCSRRHRRCTNTESPTSRRRHKPLKRCVQSLEALRFYCSV